MHFRIKTAPVFALLLALASSSAASAATYIRWNQAGYRPEQPKVVVVLSDTPLARAVWTVRKIDVATQKTEAPSAILSGEFGDTLPASPEHVPTACHYRIDLSTLGSGVYELNVPGSDSPARITVSSTAYRDLVELPLKHLRAMRSGSDDTLLRKYSHRGDMTAPVMIPDGDPAVGKWKTAAGGGTVDASGGWYDAGDQIKFTLNIAYTTYHLLTAYQLQPDLFGIVHSRTGLPDILDEARHGLEFLARSHPTPETFIVQVGNAEDHQQEARLPENDPLDGKRPALCALSRVHMASAAAALALGSRVFGERGRREDAERYAAVARRCLESCRRADAIDTAFERDQVNDFYRDTSTEDQVALAASELYFLTGDATYSALARKSIPAPGNEVSWAEWNWLANRRLAAVEPGAARNLRAEVERYLSHARGPGLPWGIPTRYVWGSLHRWVGAANAARLVRHENPAMPEAAELFYGMLDYVFGRNNWGVSFLFAQQLPNTARHLYSPMYELLDTFPTGAFSEGPGDRVTHEGLQRYFRTPADDPYHRFNTRSAVFFDHSRDFMCQEATIGGQADAVLLLTLACLEPPSAANARPSR